MVVNNTSANNTSQPTQANKENADSFISNMRNSIDNMAGIAQNSQVEANREQAKQILSRLENTIQNANTAGIITDEQGYELYEYLRQYNSVYR